MDKSKGFTLIEILVTITIIALLTIIVLVAVNRVRLSARDASRESVAGTIAKANELFENQRNDFAASVGDTGNDCAGAPANSLVGAGLMGCPRQRAWSGGGDATWDSVYTYSDPSAWSLTTDLEKGGMFRCSQEGCQ
jgi:prepilin-type N-terminal cleavage/methylation domain-containing protein